MKKKFILFLVVLNLFLYLPVNASTNTYERTNDNLLIPDDIEVTESNRSNILLTPAVNAKEKIYDFADLFSDAEELELYAKVSNYINQTSLDLAIVTINYNNKHNIQVYADDFYDYNDFGIGNGNSGSLFLIDMDTKQIYMTTTGNAIRTYTDQRYNIILGNVFTYVANGQYYNGINSLVDLMSSYAEINPLEDGNYVIENGKVVKDNNDILVCLGIALIVTIIALLIMARMNKMVFKASSSRNYLKHETMNIKKINEVFLGSSVTKVKIAESSTGSGSRRVGSSRSSSIHRGSSGRFHGGGGRRF